MKTHGFTREALSLSVLALPSQEAHTQPLSDAAVSALFGNGDAARKTLINAWLDDAIESMKTPLSSGSKVSVRDALQARLQHNGPVLPYLPEVCNSVVVSVLWTLD